MKRNIFAYTPAGSANPAYISVNEEADNRVTVTLRSNGAQVPSCIEMPRKSMAYFFALAVAIGAHLEATAPRRSQGEEVSHGLARPR